MNSISQISGLSARRRSTEKNTTSNFEFCRLLKRAILVACIAGTSVAASSCDKGSNEKTKQVTKGSVAVANDSLGKPKVNIKVNRRFDDKGNLIGFDSTYSSFYSDLKGDTVKMDSLMRNFDSYFSLNHSPLFDRQFNKLFFNDSARYPDFFHNDFFMKRYELNDQYLKGMMQDMDSIKNKFFEKDAKAEKKSKAL
jgi:hypothetical protein